jgi:DNA-binding transcriptional MocR family regulator
LTRNWPDKYHDFGDFSFLIVVLTPLLTASKLRLMRFHVDRHSDIPVNRQIADQIREAVAAGRLQPGARLPTIRGLAEQLGLNRDTVAAAYERLTADGTAESTVGRGTFVAGQASPAAAGPAALQISPLVERLLDFERTRPNYADVGDCVAMHALIPEPSLYPVDAFRRALNRALSEGGAELLLYGGPQGHAGLRDALAAHLVEAGVPASAQELVLCHGASQGISLAVRLFAAPGDAVAVEEPTYSNVLATLHSLGVRPVAVPMTSHGVDLDALERTLTRSDVKAFYTIPTFHNPMGLSTDVTHRRALVRLAEQTGKPIIEDAFEMDLGYSGVAAASLSALDRAGWVVQLFSFSKSLFPGARVGSVLARGDGISALLALKRASDLSDAMPLQAALADFVSSGAYARHLVALRRILASRRDALLDALTEHMPEGARWTEPSGGYQVWLDLPGGIDTAALLPAAARAGLLFAPGYQFNVDGRPSSAMRLTIAMADEAAIARGIAALGALVRRTPASSPRSNAAAVHV